MPCVRVCIAETSQLPAAGADGITTDGDEALAHSCRDAEWRECRHGPAIPLPQWVPGGCRGVWASLCPPERQMCSGEAESLPAFLGKAPTAGC